MFSQCTCLYLCMLRFYIQCHSSQLSLAGHRLTSRICQAPSGRKQCWQDKLHRLAASQLRTFTIRSRWAKHPTSWLHIMELQPFSEGTCSAPIKLIESRQEAFTRVHTHTEKRGLLQEQNLATILLFQANRLHQAINTDFSGSSLHCLPDYWHLCATQIATAQNNMAPLCSAVCSLAAKLGVCLPRASKRHQEGQDNCPVSSYGKNGDFIHNYGMADYNRGYTCLSFLPLIRLVCVKLPNKCRGQGRSI